MKAPDIIKKENVSAGIRVVNMTVACDFSGISYYI